MQNLSKKIGTICISAVLVLVLNNEYRQIMYMLVGCVQEQLFGPDTGDVRQQQVGVSSFTSVWCVTGFMGEKKQALSKGFAFGSS